MIKMRRPGKPGGMKKPNDETQASGPFMGTAQAAPARPGRRAHALAEELLARGCLYIQNGVFDEAAREFRKAIKMEPDYAEAYNNLGLCLLYADKPEEALAELEAALQIFPGWHIAEGNMGLALQRLSRNEEAAECYRTAVTKQKKQPAVWMALGDVLAALGQADKAAEAYETSISLAPRYGMAHFRLGMLHARRNKIDEAQASLLLAVECEPENVEAIAVLGAIAARKGILNQARDYFMKVQEAEEVPAAATRGLQRLKVFRRGLTKAFAERKGGITSVPPLAQCYYELGLAQMMADNQSAAKDAFQNAADHDPKWPDPLIWFGFFAALDGDAVSARRYWESAARLEPQNGVIREQLGYLALAMGLQKESDANFAEAAKLGRVTPKEDLQAEA